MSPSPGARASGPTGRGPAPAGRCAGPLDEGIGRAHAHQLVLGHSPSAPTHAHLGSVTRAVLREGLCPVVVLGPSMPERDLGHTHQKANAS